MDNIKTSNGQALLRVILRNLVRCEMRENYRPEWLFGMELDFYFEEFGMAFEFQGDQHFAPIFGIQSHLDQAKRDSRKRRICAERGVVVIQVEARELDVKRIKYKVFHQLCMKRKDLTKSERARWLAQVFNPCGDRAYLRKINGAKKSYCHTLKRVYVNVPSIHARGTKVRNNAIDAIWGSASAIPKRS